MPTSSPKICAAFEEVGARVAVSRVTARTIPAARSPMSIDISLDGCGEYFDIVLARGVRLNVIDQIAKDRHLLLRAWNPMAEDLFLCGHDELHWFVAALPDTSTKTVSDAKESLKPVPVRKLEERKRRGKFHRRSDVYIRQGEWFFIPCPHAGVDQRDVLRNATLRRNEESKPHVCDFLCEEGEREYECSRYPELAFFETEYREILRTRRKAKQWNWRALPFDPVRYVRGWIRHDDHAPFYLDVWHRVEVNREPAQLAMARNMYLD